jgi:tetratricopeptide (TPR) repeat protein
MLRISIVGPMTKVTLRQCYRGSASLVGCAMLALATGCGSGGESGVSTSGTPKPIDVVAQSDSETKASQKPVESNSSSISDAGPATDREQAIEASEQLQMRGDLPAAERKLKELLVRDPDDAEVIFRLATVLAERNQLAEAIELLDSIPVDHPDAGLPALGQSADWCFDLERFQDAEQRYLRVLEQVPHAPQAHRQLAYLYNRQGRRHEAAQHIEQLCRLGDVRQDELHALIQRSDAMYTPLGQPVADSDRAYWPIGPEAEARRLFMEHQYDEAVKALRPSVTEGQQPAAVIALFGRAAAESQDAESLRWWLAHVDQQSEAFSDYWAALGLMLLSQNRLQESARALLEAIARDPTDFRSISRLRSVLESIGDRDEAARLEQRFQTLEAIARQNNRIADAKTPDAEAMKGLADLLDSVGRRLEAAWWRVLAAYHQQLAPTQMQPIQTQLAQAAAAEPIPDHGSRLTAATIESRLCGIDPSRFSLPNLDALQDEVAVNTARLAPQTSAPVTPRFENVAELIGMRHTYQVASERQENGFSVYQSVGGAVAVLDYDCDGQPDLYFAQGSGDPPDFVGRESNQLFRGQDDQVVDVTQSAGAMERRYSLGVTAGDWNQDGFPDLVVANIGANTLLLNNGDGTFQTRTLDDRDDRTLMTTSLAMADLTGDQLPDLFEVNYLHDGQIGKRPRRNERGEVVETLMPKDFRPGLDRLITQTSTGDLSIREMGDRESAARAGLGIVVGDFDHQPGNEIFVGNDVYANQLWRHDKANDAWVDVAMLSGCAYGFSGAKTASMGIASGDFDRNGWLDFHITNFQGESVSHYLNEAGMYQDRNIQYGLAEPSQSVLGFGTQAIDYENDGDLDLVVTNGHIENAVNSPAPFQQPAQLFRNRGDRFELADVIDPSGYWSGRHVGRGLARVDWNRDGRIDFVVTHLGEPSALMINETDSDNHWLQIELRGVQCERDAIGARIELRIAESADQPSDEQVLVEWVTAGDGFFSRNEPVVCFGLGVHRAIDNVIIHWPSGHGQNFENIKVDQRLLIVENESQPFER